MVTKRVQNRGFTLVEALVAVVLALVLIGIVVSIFAPAQRQGANLEARLQTVRGVMLLAARLEQDVQQAQEVALEGDAIVFTSHELDRSSSQTLVRRTVRYAHQAGGQVQRTGAVSRENGPVGSCRFARVAFNAVSDEPGAVRVTVEPVASRLGRLAEEPISFLIRLPLMTEQTYWRSAMEAD